MITEVLFKDSKIPMACSANLLQKNQYEVATSFFEPALTALFHGACKALGAYVNSLLPTAVCVRDLNGQFLMGLRAQYELNEEDPSNAGNWIIGSSFNEEDFADIEPVNNIDFYDPRVSAVCSGLALTSYSMAFDDTAAMNGIFLEIIKSIIQWLNENAKADSETVLVVDKCFRAKSQIINNEVVMSISLEGEAKQQIKNDDAASRLSKL